MKLKEFREWLAQFPEDAEVSVVVGHQSSGYESFGPALETDFDPTKCGVIDSSGVSICSNHHDYTELADGRKWLVLGQTN